ncbi:hypothetical protein XENTR_v10013761 [Xenopus tropicalis]|nr:hypothetical protein XENTR_v10013761 [Xenopus tropicalis]
MEKSNRVAMATCLRRRKDCAEKMCMCRKMQTRATGHIRNRGSDFRTILAGGDTGRYTCGEACMVKRVR